MEIEDFKLALYVLQQHIFALFFYGHALIIQQKLKSLLDLTNITLRRFTATNNKQLLDVVEHDIMNYQNRGLCYLPEPKAEADNTDTRF